jgi:hypothetical protein
MELLVPRLPEMWEPRWGLGHFLALERFAWFFRNRCVPPSGCNYGRPCTGVKPNVIERCGCVQGVVSLLCSPCRAVTPFGVLKLRLSFPKREQAPALQRALPRWLWRRDRRLDGMASMIGMAEMQAGRLRYVLRFRAGEGAGSVGKREQVLAFHVRRSSFRSVTSRTGAACWRRQLESHPGTTRVRCGDCAYLSSSITLMSFRA